MKSSNSSRDMWAAPLALQTAKSLSPAGNARCSARFLFAAIFLIHTAYALDPNRAISQYVHDRWGIEDGFPQGPVYAITQGIDGYLWIGTDAGLVRFDGSTFRLVKDDSGAFTIVGVLGLTTANDGCLWLRLQDLTVVRYCNGVFESPPGDQTVRNFISAMSRTSDGDVLLARMEKGAFSFRGGRFQMLASAGGLPRSPILSLTRTPDQTIWLGTRDAGVFRLTAGKTSGFKDVLPDPKVNCLAVDANGQLIAGTDSGIARWNGTTFSKVDLPLSTSRFQALAMLKDRDANMWIGTDSQGLLRLNSSGVAYLKQPDSLSREAITSVFEDREGSVWIGSADGLERLRDSPFVTYSFPEGLPTDGANPVFVDTENRLWFPPVAGGLWWARQGTHGQVNLAGLANDVVYSIAGRKGELWLGRQHGGLTRLQTDQSSFTAKTYTQKYGLAQDSVYSVYQSRDGVVWAGTLTEGVSKLSGDHVTNYTVSDGMASNTVTAILQAADGAMWFAAPVGISVLSQGHWRTYSRRDGLSSASVNCLLQDSNGVIWAGTSLGLAFLRANRFQTPPDVPASLHEQVLGLAQDRYGSLWVATSNHVLQVNPARLLGASKRDGDVREYGLKDGIRGVEGVRRFQSVFKDPWGRVWFSLNRGISVVDPERLRRNSTPAIVHIQTVSSDGATLAMTAPLHVAAGRQRLVIEYVGLSLAVPERVRFRYRLDGFDSQWTEPTAERQAVYTNLSPNKYSFHVVASNPDGIWNAQEAAISFTVDPLFWQTWWFRLSVVFACLVSILAVYRLRLRHLSKQLSRRFEERLDERTHIAQELHDTLLQGFLSASMYVHLAAGQVTPESSAKPSLTRALQLMTQVIEEGRNTLRGLRSSPGSSLDLEVAFSNVAQEFAHDGQTEIPDFRVAVSGQHQVLHPIIRDELYRIGREAVINAFRHAQAKTIELEMKYSARHLRLLVRDDGCGIDPHSLEAPQESHLGLIGMRERADRIGAKLRVFTSASAGTEIELKVPGNVAFQDPSRGKLKRFLTKP